MMSVNWSEFARRQPFLTDLGEGSSAAVGGAMQEAYELLERRSLDGCIAACFDAEERGGETATSRAP